MDLHSMLLILFKVCLAITFGTFRVHAAEFNVLDYKAAGNAITDDTKAFEDAWAATCAATDDSSKMIIPAGKTFFVKPIIFKGPCKPSVVNVEVSGVIVAPEDPDEWKSMDAALWLKFDSVNGLVLNGSGLIDGRGSKWWEQSCRYTQGRHGCTTLAPTAIQIISSKDVVVSDMKLVNSPQTHLLIMGSQMVTISNMDISSPESSPNTDGIHIHNSQHVKVQNCTIASGDDCISIGDYIYDVIINEISCGPGHGISIGSLGLGGSNASVEQIHVSNVNLTGTTNGARIKTWQGGRGFAKNISFRNFNLNNVQYPITIDQYYFCYKEGVCAEQNDAVEISNIEYGNFHGTSASQVAIMLNCSRSVACTEIHLSDINLSASPDNTGGDVKQVCVNAHYSTHGTVKPDGTCLHK